MIAVEQLTKDYGAVRAVDDLSFTVPRGAVVGFLGPNGSGNSTTLRALLGLVRPTAGTARIDGRPYAELADPLRTVGAVLDAVAHPALTGRLHLRAPAAEAGASRARVDQLLELVELSGAADRRYGGYSLGIGQRLGLAGALVGDPGLLVLDEPANGLDPEAIRWLRDFLRALAGEGRTVLLSSHVLSEVGNHRVRAPGLRGELRVAQPDGGVPHRLRRLGVREAARGAAGNRRVPAYSLIGAFVQDELLAGAALTVIAAAAVPAAAST